MVQAFFIWLFGPDLAGLLLFLLVMGGIFTVVHRGIQGKWWWK